MTTEAGFDPLAILRVLAAHGVPYVVIGGFAVAAHKVVRATRDLDLVTERSWAAAQRLADAMSELDAQSAVDQSVGLVPEVFVRPVNLRIATRHGEVHLLNATAHVPPFGELERMTIRVEGLDISVASLGALRAMKRAAGRPKDLVDLAELDAIHGPAP